MGSTTMCQKPKFSRDHMPAKATNMKAQDRAYSLLTLGPPEV